MPRYKDAYVFDDWKQYPRLPDAIEFQALCRSAPIDWFFPQKGKSAIGKRLCLSCPVQEECLNYAITNAVHFGVWGGMTERERHSERQRRKQRHELS